MLEPLCTEGQDFRLSEVRVRQMGRMLADTHYQETLIWIKWANTEHRYNCKLAGLTP